MAEPFTPEHIVQLREQWDLGLDPYLTGLATDRLFAIADALTERLRFAEAVVEAARDSLQFVYPKPRRIENALAAYDAMVTQEPT